jgi:ABC-2 type transport system permease protein
VARLLRVYRALLRAAWATTLEYRAQALLWILSGVFPLVMMAVWLAVVDEAGPISGWGRAEFTAYYVGAALVQELSFVFVVWDWDRDIREGLLSVKLLKPLDPFHHLLSEQLGWKLFFLAIIVPPVALFIWLSPDIGYPLTLGRAVAFVLSILAAFALSMAMGSTFGVLSFWSTQTKNLYSLWVGAGYFLAGWIAPLALFPEGIRRLASWLPFRSTLGFPMEILMGQLTGPEIAFGFAVAILWIAVFAVLYRALYRRGLRRYEAVGA